MVFGDADSQAINRCPDTNAVVTWHVAMRPGKRRAHNKASVADAFLEQIEKLKAGVRTKIEHSFKVIKRQFGFVKARYRGLKKNTAQLNTLFAISILWMVRGKLMRAGALMRLQTGQVSCKLRKWPQSVLKMTRILDNHPRNTTVLESQLCYST